MASLTTGRPRLQATLRNLPARPGVYLFRGATGQVLYVGKADSLRNRVRSYFAAGARHEPRLARLVADVADLDTIVTDTVSEAYLLECNLIKEHRPRFNIRLRDDKSYPFVRITLGEDFPRIVRTRRLVRDGSRYFGPYASASSVDDSLRLLSKIFPFRTCDLDIPEGRPVLERPCLLYHIKRCQGPCIGAIGKAEYRETINEVIDFLEGRQEGIADGLRKEMLEHSEALEYEAAAASRDKLRAVERTIEDQKVAAFSRAEHDVMGLAREGNEAALQVLVIRNGKMIGREHFVVEGAGEVTDGEVVAAFLQQFYTATERIPRSVLVPIEPADGDGLRAFLGERRGGPVAISVPQRGEKRQLVAMAGQNAAEALGRDRAEWMADQAKRDEALAGLTVALGLPRPPRRIECYDISNIQGTSAVGSMVVFIDGAPTPKEYRRFQIRGAETPDDFRMMDEVLRRRLARAARLRAETGALSAAAVGAEEDVGGWALPDLLIVDGGKGQLSTAVAVLTDLGMTDIPAAGLAKRFEEVFLPGRSDPIILGRTAPALYLLQRIRDEAHRFAITYHRQVRGRRALEGALDQIAGIGPARKRALLKRFGSVRAIREASVEDIAAVPAIPADLAARVKAGLVREGMLG